MSNTTPATLARSRGRLTLKEVAIIGAHAFVGWLLCTSIMAIGPMFIPMQTTLIVHAIGAPIIYTNLSLVYFTRFNYTTPIQTALIFVGFVIFMDFFLVALVVLKSLEMFTSPIGTWIPFSLIAASTYLTGLFVTRQKAATVRTI